MDVSVGRDTHFFDGAPVDVVFRDWGISFGRRPILAGINLRLGKLGVTVLMGPVGSGKSLILKVLAGQSGTSSKAHGDLFFDGVPVSATTVRPALVQQHPRDLARSVFEMLIDGLRGGTVALSPMELKSRLLSTLRRYDQGDLEEYFSCRLFDLPRGAMRRALLMRAALSDSSMLLIDEPTSGLTSLESSQVLRLISALAESKSCLVVLHHQSQARALADRVVLLAGGQIQVDAEVASFFENTEANPVLAQFLRTGSCSLPALGAQLEDLAEGAWQGNVIEQRSVEEDSGDGDDAASGVVDSDEELGNSLSKVEAPSFVPASRGPNGFRWLIPGKLAGCPMPGAMLPLEHDLELLRNMGVTILINLTEAPMTQTAIPAFGLRTIHMRVEDRNAPPLLWMKLLLAQIDKFMQQGEVIAVHCLAGLGRTGTVLGAWLVREGLTAEEALKRLREIEPGFVQSRVQEELLQELEVNLLIRAPNL